MSLQYIIDGCNIIHNPIFNQGSNKKTEDKRIALLEFINSKRLTGSPRNKVAVIFDGYPGRELISRLNSVRKEANIIFSGKETADDKIRKILEGSGNNKNTIIISDDKEIKFLARNFLARYSSVEEFLGLKKQRPPKAARASEAGEENSISYLQMQLINQELRERWLKP